MQDQAERDEAGQAQAAVVPAQAPRTELPQTELPAPQAQASLSEAPQAEATKTEAPQAEVPRTEDSTPQAEVFHSNFPTAQSQTEILTPQAEVPQFETPQSETPQAQAPQAPQDGTALRLNLQGWAPRIHYWSVRRVRRRASYQPPEDPQARLARLYHYGPIYVVPDVSAGRMRRNSSNAAPARCQCPRNTAPPQRRYSDQLPRRPLNLQRTVSGQMMARPDSDLQQASQRSMIRSQSVPPHTMVVTRVRQAAIVEQAYYSEHPQLPRSTGLVEPPRMILEGTTTEGSFQQDTFQYGPEAQPDFGEAWMS